LVLIIRRCRWVRRREEKEGRRRREEDEEAGEGRRRRREEGEGFTADKWNEIGGRVNCRFTSVGTLI